jgi:hypothetical protein
MNCQGKPLSDTVAAVTNSALSRATVYFLYTVFDCFLFIGLLLFTTEKLLTLASQGRDAAPGQGLALICFFLIFSSGGFHGYVCRPYHPHAASVPGSKPSGRGRAGNGH